MNKRWMMVITAALLGIGSVASAATDYSRYSDEDLARMHGKLRNAPFEERNAYRNEWQKRMADLGPDDRVGYMRGPEAPRMNGRMRWMQVRLGLSDSQSLQVEKIMQNEFSVSGSEREKLRKLNQDLQSESMKKRPDRKQINALAEMIGRSHALLARQRSSHMAEIATLLTPEQREKFQSMVNLRPMSGPCGMRFQQ